MTRIRRPRTPRSRARLSRSTGARWTAPRGLAGARRPPGRPADRAAERGRQSRALPIGSASQCAGAARDLYGQWRTSTSSDIHLCAVHVSKRHTHFLMADGNFTAESAAQVRHLFLHRRERYTASSRAERLPSVKVNKSAFYPDRYFEQISCARVKSGIVVESLLIEKPENPIGFIVEFLQKK